jgi:lipid II isoglutaminyl synthase (glutamine-hydrolysing)
MDLKSIFTIYTLKTLKRGLAITRIGSGTALPGLLAENHRPQLFNYFANQLEFVILITGTNGKTTTKALLSDILDEGGIKHISNESGSNLRRGILSTFISKSNIFGRLNSKFAVFEVEEATLPKIVKEIKPNILIVTNLFRDQLDAYGEVNKTREYILDALKLCPSTKVILNADDPMVSSLSKGLINEFHYFSMPKEYRKEVQYEKSTGSLTINPNQSIDAITPSSITLTADLSSKFTVHNQEFKLKAPGFFHIYNALAAIQTTRLLEIKFETIKAGFEKFKPAFGRGEELTINGIKMPTHKQAKWKFKILLVKNPAGLTLTLKMLSELKNPNLLFILNDKIADGKDVSWIWDADLELLKKIQPNKIFISGLRSKDMALRIKYALGESYLEKENNIKVQTYQRFILRKIKQEMPDGGMIFVLPTYTAMNEFRKLLGRKF